MQSGTAAHTRCYITEVQVHKARPIRMQNGSGDLMVVAVYSQCALARVTCDTGINTTKDLYYIVALSECNLVYLFLKMTMMHYEYFINIFKCG